VYCAKDSQWYVIDDELCDPLLTPNQGEELGDSALNDPVFRKGILKSKVVTRYAYLLLYVRKDLKGFLRQSLIYPENWPFQNGLQSEELSSELRRNISSTPKLNKQSKFQPEASKERLNTVHMSGGDGLQSLSMLLPYRKSISFAPKQEIPSGNISLVIPPKIIPKHVLSSDTLEPLEQAKSNAKISSLTNLDDA